MRQIFDGWPMQELVLVGKHEQIVGQVSQNMSDINPWVSKYTGKCVKKNAMTNGE